MLLKSDFAIQQDNIWPHWPVCYKIISNTKRDGISILVFFSYMWYLGPTLKLNKTTSSLTGQYTKTRGQTWAVQQNVAKKYFSICRLGCTFVQRKSDLCSMSQPLLSQASLLNIVVTLKHYKKWPDNYVSVYKIGHTFVKRKSVLNDQHRQSLASVVRLLNTEVRLKRYKKVTT